MPGGRSAAGLFSFWEPYLKFDLLLQIARACILALVTAV